MDIVEISKEILVVVIDRKSKKTASVAFLILNRMQMILICSMEHYLDIINEA